MFGLHLPASAIFQDGQSAHYSRRIVLAMLLPAIFTATQPIVAQPSSNPTTPLTHDRLSLQLPGKWQTAKSQQIVRAQPAFTDAGGIGL